MVSSFNPLAGKSFGKEIEATANDWAAEFQSPCGEVVWQRLRGYSHVSTITNVSIPLRGSRLAKFAMTPSTACLLCFNPLAGKSFGKAPVVVALNPQFRGNVSIPLRGSRLAKFFACYLTTLGLWCFNPLAGKSFGKGEFA